MNTHKPPVLTADDLRVVDCAACGTEMIGEAQWREIAEGRAVTCVLLPPRVYVRVAGRPYCKVCHDGPAPPD